MGISARAGLVRLLPVIAVLAIVFGPGHRTLSAEYQCFWNLKRCYYRAATYKSYVDLWLSGLDCELSFVDCARRAIIGR